MSDESGHNWIKSQEAAWHAHWRLLGWCYDLYLKDSCVGSLVKSGALRGDGVSGCMSWSIVTRPRSFCLRKGWIQLSWEIWRKPWLPFLSEFPSCHVTSSAHAPTRCCGHEALTRGQCNVVTWSWIFSLQNWAEKASFLFTLPRLEYFVDENGLIWLWGRELTHLVSKGSRGQSGQSTLVFPNNIYSDVIVIQLSECLPGLEEGSA